MGYAVSFFSCLGSHSKMQISSRLWNCKQKVMCQKFCSIISQTVRQVRKKNPCTIHYCSLHHGASTGYFPAHLDLECTSADISGWCIWSYGQTMLPEGNQNPYSTICSVRINAYANETAGCSVVAYFKLQAKSHNGISITLRVVLLALVVIKIMCLNL